MHLNRFVCDTVFSPVTEAISWLDGRTFPPEFPLIDVSQAVPGYPAPAPLIDHMAVKLREPGTGKYGDVLGLPELRNAYAQHLRSVYHSDAASALPLITAENIAITAGCNQGFYIAVASLCAAGDQVILPAPWYFNHKMTLDMLGVDTVALDCDPAQEMIPDCDLASALITEKTRAIALISPNNPTGVVYPPQVIDAFYALAKDRGLALILDETYVDFRPQPRQAPHHIFQDRDWAEHAIHLYSFSKSYALAGYRVGALAGSERLLYEITKVLDCVTICASQLSQFGALYGLQNESKWKEEKRSLLYTRANAFKEAIEQCQRTYEITAMGAYFAYLKHPFTGCDSNGLARFLADKANLLALPGQMFGEHQHQYLRVAFANVEENLMPEIAERLSRYKPG